MSDTVILVQRYLDVWNETDPDRRREAVEALWTENARYLDPVASAAGHEEISNLIGAVQDQLPGHVFRLLDGFDSHHNLTRFSWELVPATGGESLVEGFDVAVTGDDGRIESVLGFLDKVPPM
jgi:SnoaL-like domain